MKTIGLLGGMSWESTADYYRLINEAVKGRLGGLHSASIILNSIDFAPIERLQMHGDWTQAGVRLAQAARQVEQGGADCLLICTNTMHCVADTITQNLTIPLLHIADVTARAILAKGYQKVGLLGTAFTMEQDFYRGRLAEHFGIEVAIPEEKDRAFIHQAIYQELCLGQFNPATRAAFVAIIEAMAESGCQAIILGCTEIGMLVSASDTKVALLDTTRLHALAAVDFALS